MRDARRRRAAGPNRASASSTIAGRSRYRSRPTAARAPSGPEVAAERRRDDVPDEDASPVVRPPSRVAIERPPVARSMPIRAMARSDRDAVAQARNASSAIHGRSADGQARAEEAAGRGQHDDERARDDVEDRPVLGPERRRATRRSRRRRPARARDRPRLRSGASRTSSGRFVAAIAGRFRAIAVSPAPAVRDAVAGPRARRARATGSRRLYGPRKYSVPSTTARSRRGATSRAAARNGTAVRTQVDGRSGRGARASRSSGVTHASGAGAGRAHAPTSESSPHRSPRFRGQCALGPYRRDHVPAVGLELGLLVAVHQVQVELVDAGRRPARAAWRRGRRPSRGRRTGRSPRRRRSAALDEPTSAWWW